MRMLDVRTCCSPTKRMPRCVPRCARKVQQVREARRKERTHERKPAPYDNFSSSGEYNLAGVSETTRIVVPTMYAWYYGELTGDKEVKGTAGKS